MGRVGLVHVPSSLTKPVVKGESYEWDCLPGHVQLSIAKSAALQSKDAYIAYCKTRNPIREHMHPVYLIRMLSYARARRDQHHRIADKWMATLPCDSDEQPKSEECSFEFDSKRVYYRVLSYGLITYNLYYSGLPGVKPKALSEMIDVQVRVPAGWNPPIFPLPCFTVTRWLNWMPTRI